MPDRITYTLTVGWPDRTRFATVGTFDGLNAALLGIRAHAGIDARFDRPDMAVREFYARYADPGQDRLYILTATVPARAVTKFVDLTPGDRFRIAPANGIPAIDTVCVKTGVRMFRAETVPDCEIYSVSAHVAPVGTPQS